MDDDDDDSVPFDKSACVRIVIYFSLPPAHTHTHTHAHEETFVIRLPKLLFDLEGQIHHNYSNRY